MFDPRRHLALLQVGSLGETPLSLLVAHAGATGAVFGHPNGQDPIAITPARVAAGGGGHRPRPLRHGHHPARRAGPGRRTWPTATRAVRWSTAVGRVIGVAFAISADQPGTSYALSTTELELALGESRSASGGRPGPA